MKLWIAIISATVVIRFDVPGPGRYYLFSSDDAQQLEARVEASNHVQRCEHVSVPMEDSRRIYWTVFIPDGQ